MLQHRRAARVREKDRSRMVSGAMPSHLKEPKEVWKGEFEFKVKRGEVRNCFSIVMPYFCRTADAKNMAAVRYGAGKRLFCVSWHSTYKDTMINIKSSSRVVTESLDTRGKIGRR